MDVDKNGWHAHGDLSFYDINPFPKTLFMRGIMGPFCFIPHMECNHGIVNIRHTIKGGLEINGRQEVFDGGTGYIEKDWGTSFPTGYIWMQSHDFDQNSTFMFSAADIPFLNRRFLGILCFLYIDGRYISVSTYNGAKITAYKLENDRVAITLSNKKYMVSIDIKKAKGSSLQAPAKGLMDRTIEETLNATATIDFLQANKKPLYQGSLTGAGLEICGDVEAMFYKYLKF